MPRESLLHRMKCPEEWHSRNSVASRRDTLGELSDATGANWERIQPFAFRHESRSALGTWLSPAEMFAPTLKVPHLWNIQPKTRWARTCAKGVYASRLDSLFLRVPLDLESPGAPAAE